MFNSEPQVISFAGAVTAGTGKTFYVALFGETDLLFSPNAIEACLNVVKTGTGVNPSLIVKIQSSNDGFVTAAGIKDMLTFSTATGTMTETKRVSTSDASPVLSMGRQRRVSIVVAADSGDATFTGTLNVIQMNV